MRLNRFKSMEQISDSYLLARRPLLLGGSFRAPRFGAGLLDAELESLDELEPEELEELLREEPDPLDEPEELKRSHKFMT